MKKIFAIATAAIGLLLASCTTLVPVQGNNPIPSSVNCKVLGRVKVEANSFNSGYNKLMDAALAQYPNADDIVDILIDEKSTTFLFIFRSYKYIMSAVVVDYE